MKKATRTFLIGAFIGSAFAAQTALASPYPSGQVYPAVGDKIKLSDGYGSVGGGEFNVDVLNKGGVLDYITFCLEKDESISFGASYKVQGITGKAQNGGVNTNSGDPLDVRTAFLYYHFAMGDLTGYDYTGASHVKDANDLQNAIWYLEQEQSSYTVTGGTDYVALATAGILDPTLWQWGPTSLGYVRVVNLVTDDARELFRQDVLTVPEPTTLFLLGSGLLLGAAQLGRRKKN